MGSQDEQPVAEPERRPRQGRLGRCDRDEEKCEK
jgi:hypothetical protein